MSSSEARSEIVLELAEEFLDRYRKGERPPLKEYIDRHPELASEIKEVFPAMAMMEKIAVADESVEAGKTSEVSKTSEVLLKQLGDYRIIREIGHGGMGVVYEAEQLSLARHVALKVLPGQALQDAKHKRRFEREAKAAAKLHHTNIVPVFGVGEHEGLPYYVMQFIQGLGLDAVLDELNRMQPGAANAPSGLPTAGEIRIARRDVSAAAVACSLMTGEFQEPDADAEANEPNARPVVGATEDRPAGGRPQVHSPAPAPSGSGRLSDSFTISSSSITLPGLSVTGQKTAKKPTYWQSVANIGWQVADALEYAHKQGVLHRDVKPSNLLLDLRGTAWVTDFGLAKVAGPGAADGDNITHTGDVLGTLRYMPPEAFEGKSDARSDVYSLGLTLYELLALRPAFDEKDRNKLIKQVTTGEPAALDKLSREAPPDLVTIVHKAIEREPSRRYATAEDLASDLQRFLDDEPILARRQTQLERYVRWARHNPGIAVLGAVLTAVLVLVTVASLLAAGYFNRLRLSEAQAAQSERDARQARERTLTDMYTSFGIVAGERGDPAQGVLWFAHAARQAGAGTEREKANRARVRTWGRQSFQPVRALVHQDSSFLSFAFHPRGHYLMTQSFRENSPDITCTIWDLARETPVAIPEGVSSPRCAAWSPDGRWLALGSRKGEVAVSTFPDGMVQHRLLFAAGTNLLVFSPDGHYLALAGGAIVRVWDCRTAAFATAELKHPAGVSSVAFHPGSHRLATGCGDNKARVFALPNDTGQPLFPPVPHYFHRGGFGTKPVAPTFVDKGRGLLTVDRTAGATWHDAETGVVLRAVPLNGPPVRDRTVRDRQVLSMAASPDGKYFVLGTYGGAQMWEVATARAVGAFLAIRELQRVVSVSFSPDGQTLLTGSDDHTARRWAVPTGAAKGGLLTHPTNVELVAFAPDGRSVATAQQGGQVRIWTLPGLHPGSFRMPLNGVGSHGKFSGDGKYVLATGMTFGGVEQPRSTQVYEVATGRAAGSPIDAGGLLLDAAFSPDGRQVATLASSAASGMDRHKQPAQQAGRVRLWDWRTGKLARTLPMPSEPRSLDYNPDGRRLAVLCIGGQVAVIDAVRGQIIREWRADAGPVHNGYWVTNGALRFSPDGESLVLWGIDAAVRVCEAATGRERYRLQHQQLCHGVEFSPEGRLLATTSFDNTARIWNFATGQAVGAPLAHPDWVFSARFRSDGKHLLTACRDNMARLWDWETARLVCPAFKHEHEIHAAAFTPDGRYILTVGVDRTARVWEGLTGKPVTPPLKLRDIGLSLAVSSDSRHVVAGGLMNVLDVLHMGDLYEDDGLSSEDLCTWGEIISGQRVEGGGVTNLTAEEWLERWRGFRRSHPGKAPASPAEALIEVKKTKAAK